MSIVKRIYASLKRQATLQSAAICGNLRQSITISSNLPVPVTLLGTATACTITARKEGRKEGRKEKYIYRYSNCIVVKY